MVGICAQQAHGTSLETSLRQDSRAFQGHAHLTDMQGKNFQTSFGAQNFIAVHFAPRRAYLR